MNNDFPWLIHCHILGITDTRYRDKFLLSFIQPLTGNGVYSEAYVVAVFGEERDHLGDGVLGLGHAHTVSRHNDDILSISNFLDGVGHVDFLVFSLNVDLCRRDTVTAENDVGQGTVHGLKDQQSPPFISSILYS